MNWIFLRNRLKGFDGRKSETVDWKQKSNFSGRKGDKVLILNYDRSGWYFTHLYKIVEVNIATSEGRRRRNADNEIARVIRVEMQLEKVYAEEKDLFDYIFSFPRVKNYKENLYRHFYRRYYRISDLEFDAVDKDQIYISRTILGTTVNSLPIDHRRSFSEYLVENDPHLFQGNDNTLEVVRLLKEYIDFAIVTPANCLEDAHKMMSSFIGAEEASRVAFLDSEEGARLNYIQRQVEVINDNIKAINELNIIWQQGIDTSLEQRYRKLFSGRTLPIELN